MPIFTNSLIIPEPHYQSLQSTNTGWRIKVGLLWPIGHGLNDCWIVFIKNGKRSTRQTRDTRQSAGIKSKSNRTRTAGVNLTPIIRTQLSDQTTQLRKVRCEHTFLLAECTAKISSLFSDMTKERIDVSSSLHRCINLSSTAFYRQWFWILFSQQQDSIRDISKCLSASGIFPSFYSFFHTLIRLQIEIMTWDTSFQ